MSLDKAIEHGKEHRKPYYGAKAVDPWCRNHRHDAWMNYKHKRRKEQLRSDSNDDD